MKNNKWSRKGLKIDDVALNGAFSTHKKYGVQISSIKWNPFVRDDLLSETLILRKRLSVFVHEVHPVFAVTISTFLHMLCGWNDDTMPTFNLFGVHLKCFKISGSYSWKKSIKPWKITNEVRKGWKLMMCLWMVHFEHRKTMEFK